MTCRSCATCAWWERMGPRLANACRDPSSPIDTGTCQLNAPSTQPAERFPVSVWPQTHESRFCGQWKAHDGYDPDDGERIIAFPLNRPANKVAA